MLQITNKTSIPLSEIELAAIRSQGAGGQNVNKVASAIHLRFNINASSLPPLFKQRLLNLTDRRITAQGVIIIKAQQFRTQELNKEDALARLRELIKRVAITAPKRRPTKPSRSSKSKRLNTKTKHSRLKSLRAKITD